MKERVECPKCKTHLKSWNLLCVGDIQICSCGTRFKIDKTERVFYYETKTICRHDKDHDYQPELDCGDGQVFYKCSKCGESTIFRPITKEYYKICEELESKKN